MGITISKGWSLWEGVIGAYEIVRARTREGEVPVVFEDGQKGPGGWSGAGRQKVVGSEVRERREGQILEDLEDYCKYFGFY